MTPDDDKAKSKRHLIIAAVVIAVIGLAIYLFSLGGDQDEGPVAPKNTQPTVSIGSYEGDGELRKRGLMNAQIKAIKIAANNYAKSEDKRVSRTIITNTRHSVQKLPNDDRIHTYSFDLSQDGIVHQARVELISNTAIRMYLYNASDPINPIYDSRVIDMDTQGGE